MYSDELILDIVEEISKHPNRDSFQFADDTEGDFVKNSLKHFYALLDERSTHMFSLVYEGTDHFSVKKFIVDFLTPDEPVFLCPFEDNRDYFYIFKAKAADIADIIDELFFDEYFIVTADGSKMMTEDHHSAIIVYSETPIDVSLGLKPFSIKE